MNTTRAADCCRTVCRTEITRYNSKCQPSVSHSCRPYLVSVGFRSKTSSSPFPSSKLQPPPRVCYGANKHQTVLALLTSYSTLRCTDDLPRLPAVLETLLFTFVLKPSNRLCAALFLRSNIYVFLTTL